VRNSKPPVTFLEDACSSSLKISRPSQRQCSSESIDAQVDCGDIPNSSPFLAYGVVPVGARSTSIRLKSGDLWVLASSPLDDKTRETIDEMGPVKYLIGPSDTHRLYLGALQHS
jgi:hypothetical protein